MEVGVAVGVSVAGLGSFEVRSGSGVSVGVDVGVAVGVDVSLSIIPQAANTNPQMDTSVTFKKSRRETSFLSGTTPPSQR